MTQLPDGCHPDCRACQHRLLTLRESLNQKANFLTKKLHPWAELIEAVRSPDEAGRWGYRRKTTVGVRFEGTKWQWGLWRRNDLLHIPQCPVHHPSVNLILNAVMESLPAYDFGLRWLVMSGSQLTMVVKQKRSPLLAWPSSVLADRLEQLGLEGLWLHLNPSTGRRIFGKGGWSLIWGKAYSVDDDGLFYGPAAFGQLIPSMYAESLDITAAFLNPDAHSAVIDLYSGTGSSIRQWQQRGAQVLGVEAMVVAVNMAAVNVPEARVLVGACRLRLPQLEAWRLEQTNQGKKILLYANPPRPGIEPEVLHWIAQKARPLRMAYLSCSPGTLAHNLYFLSNNGFTIEKLIPFDFFPQTLHVETLALIRLNP